MKKFILLFTLFILTGCTINVHVPDMSTPTINVPAPVVNVTVPETKPLALPEPVVIEVPGPTVEKTKHIVCETPSVDKLLAMEFIKEDDYKLTADPVGYVKALKQQTDYINDLRTMISIELLICEKLK